MKLGSQWYKREPVSYLGGVQGLSAKEHAVYSVTLDLIYQYGGEINNDPSWIAGWINDMGAAAVRKTINKLCERGKLILIGDKITQKRAKNEAQTKQNLIENAAKNGKKGGEKSAKIKAEYRKNNDLGEATASSQNQADKIRVDKNIGGGGYTRAPTREADDPGKSNPDLRIKILKAMGLDETGQLGPSGKLVGTRADMIAAYHWQNALGLTATEIVETVQDVMRSKPDGPPSNFKYFTPAMQRLADAKAAPPPQIGGTNDTGSHQAHTGRANHGPRRRSPHDERLEAFLRVGRELDRREAENRGDD